MQKLGLNNKTLDTLVGMDPEASWASVNLPNSKLESLLKKEK